MRMKIVFTCSISVVFVALCVAGASATPGVPLLTAEQIIGKNLAARGGVNTWQQVTSMTMSGHMDVGSGVQVPYTMEMKRGRKIRIELQFQGQTAVQVYDGANGWKKRPFLGRTDVEPFTAEELQKAALDSDIDGPLMDHIAKGTRAELDGVEKVEGRETYKLKLTLKAGQVRHVWIDALSFLETKIDGTRRMDGKSRTIETYYRDYRKVQGLTLPFVYDTAVAGVKATDMIHIEMVKVNPELDDSLFAKPH